MPEDPQLLVKIGADTSGVEAGMDAGTEAVQAGADDMAAAFAKATAAASALTDKLAALSAANIATADTAKAAAKSFQSGGGFGGPRYMATYGASAAAGMSRFGFVLARLGSMSQMIFPALLAGLGAIAAVHLGSIFVKWEQNTIDLTGALKELRAENEKLVQSVRGAKYGYLEAEAEQAKLLHHTAQYVSLLHEARSYAPASVPVPDAKSLAALKGHGLHVAALMSQIGQEKTIGGLESLVPKINALILRLHAFKAKATASAELLGAAQTVGTAIGMSSSLTGGGPNEAVYAQVVAETKAAHQAMEALRRINTRIGYLHGTENLKTSNQILTLHDHARKANSAAHRKVSEYDYERTHPNAMSAHSGYFTYYEKEAEAENKLAKADAVLAASKAKLASAMTVKGAVTFGDLMKQDDKRLEENSKRASESVLKSWEELRKKQAQEAKAIQTEQKKIAQGLFGGFNEGLKESIKGVMMGTESINMAWRRMMGNMLLSTITNWAEILMQHAEGWAAMEILKAAGIATSERMDQVHAAKSAATDSHLSASHAFEKAMGSYPPPLNVPIAIAAAAAAAAANMSIAGFATGGIVPNTGIALVHQGEAVLPRPLTDHLMASAGKGGHGPTNITVHALDGADATNVLTRNRGAVATSLHRQLRAANLVQ